MTLCVVWRRNQEVHFASDSRLTVANNSYADVAIKVLAVPYRIYAPRDQSGERTLSFQGELGMCFAGSAVNSFFVKESVVEVLKELQYAPGYTNVSMAGLADFIFTAYRLISTQVCNTVLGDKGRAAIVVAGHCTEQKRTRAFLLETSDQNEHSYKEILLGDGYVFIGSGKSEAESALPANPSDLDYLNALKTVIDDPNVESVAGAVQYGKFSGSTFTTKGIVEFRDGVHYWRGALDLNSHDFMGKHDALIPGYQYIDPFDTFDR